MIEVTELKLDEFDFFAEYGMPMPDIKPGCKVIVSLDKKNIHVTAISMLEETKQLIGEIYKFDESFDDDPDLGVGKHILFILENIHSIETNPDIFDVPIDSPGDGNGMG